MCPSTSVFFPISTPLWVGRPSFLVGKKMKQKTLLLVLPLFNIAVFQPARAYEEKESIQSAYP
jgi:hypothetical protein